MILASAPVEKGKTPTLHQPTANSGRGKSKAAMQSPQRPPGSPWGALELDGPEKKKIGLNVSTLTSATHWILASVRKGACP